jgi:hypothetical protein
MAFCGGVLPPAVAGARLSMVYKDGGDWCLGTPEDALITGKEDDGLLPLYGAGLAHRICVRDTPEP